MNVGVNYESFNCRKVTKTKLQQGGLSHKMTKLTNLFCNQPSAKSRDETTHLKTEDVICATGLHVLSVHELWNTLHTSTSWKQDISMHTSDSFIWVDMISYIFLADNKLYVFCFDMRYVFICNMGKISPAW
jgi:hypothetical protein